MRGDRAAGRVQRAGETAGAHGTQGGSWLPLGDLQWQELVNPHGFQSRGSLGGPLPPAPLQSPGCVTLVSSLTVSGEGVVVLRGLGF